MEAPTAPPTSPLDVTTMIPAQRDAEIVRLQAETFDHSGHVYAGLPTSRRRALVNRINALRKANGWSPINMKGRIR